MAGGRWPSFDVRFVNLRGERREEKEDKGRTWHRVEQRYGAFTRSVRLPCPVEGEDRYKILELGDPAAAKELRELAERGIR